MTKMLLTTNDILKYQQQVVDEFVMLTAGESGAHAQFSHLVSATNIELQKLGSHQTILLPHPESAYFGLAIINDTKAEISKDLVSGWLYFAELYPALVERSPRLELRNLMQDMSERAGGASWPDGSEWAIETWVSAGAPEDASPYPVAFGVRERLLKLHSVLKGWLYLSPDPDSLTTIFSETSVFRQVKVRLDAERAERIQQERRRYEEATRQT